ncbi:MAG: aspartate aminotransferase family protein [Balneolaceae bacterium]|nr:aspartate aminotransferase family protein [Balneolaceae bacterium]
MEDPKKITGRFHLDVYNRYPVTLVEGRGARVWDDGGNEYIDALAGIAVNSLGHCHPEVVEAIREQSGRLMHISNFYYSKQQARLVEKLAQLSNCDRVFLCNSGAEAIEGAIKLARKAAKERGKNGPILTMSGAFHGRTMAAISMGMEKYRKGYDPLLPGFETIPFNDHDALREAFDENTTGIILELVQGSGGLQVAEPDFVNTVQSLCEKHDALLILDEVQTGIGRTGRMFAYEHFGINPDIIASAKALGGGFPIGAFMATEEVASAMQHGDHGSTFGGNPLACHAAYTTLNVIEEYNLAEEARNKGKYLRKKLESFASGSDRIVEVRGLGLMIGVELTFPCREVVERMIPKGILSNCTAGNVIRLVPPIVITYQELDRLFKVLSETIGEADGST